MNSISKRVSGDPSAGEIRSFYLPLSRALFETRRTRRDCAIFAKIRDPVQRRQNPRPRRLMHPPLIETSKTLHRRISVQAFLREEPTPLSLSFQAAIISSTRGINARVEARETETRRELIVIKSPKTNVSVTRRQRGIGGHNGGWRRDGRNHHRATVEKEKKEVRQERLGRGREDMIEREIAIVLYLSIYVLAMW